MVVRYLLMAARRLVCRTIVFLQGSRPFAAKSLISAAASCARTLLLLGLLALNANAQLRIVNYNTAGVPNSSSMQTVLNAITNESVNGIVKPIDVMILQELSSGDIATIRSMLNGLGGGAYTASVVGGTTGAGGVGFVYRNATVQAAVVEQIVAANTSGAERAVMRLTFRPVGYNDPSSNIYIYNSHYKAGDTSADRTQRNQEAAAIRANADALGDGRHIIYAGDFNIYRSTEPMWATLTAPGNGQAFDPVNQVGNWHDNNNFRGVHTQNPAGSGFVGGGMDDRFDWQMITNEFNDGDGLSIIPGSYRAFGNSGNHVLNGHINSSPGGASNPVLNALGAASDHLPVVAEYQVPAKMAVAVSSVPSALLVGASASATVNVSNSAGDGVVVVAPNGADELNYTVQGSNAVAGSFSGADSAFGGSNNHVFTLDTSTAGLKTATFTTTATSAQVPDAVNIAHRNYTVFDHATPSFSASAPTQSLTHDFGDVAAGSEAPSFDFSLFNINGLTGYTADLEFDSVDAAGDVHIFSTDLSAAAGSLVVAGGASESFSATFSTLETGAFAATYTLFLSDPALPGAQNYTLELTLAARVVAAALAGDYNDDGMVDAADYVVWRKSLETGMALANETRSIGVTDAEDYDAWTVNFGALAEIGGGNIGSTSPAVPEPSSVALSIIALCIANFNINRNRKKQPRSCTAAGVCDPGCYKHTGLLEASYSRF